MPSDFKVSRCSRRCHTLDRPLREGESYYSVVSEAEDGYLRRDFSAEAWQGPPEDAVAWWRSRMPKADEKRRVLAPKEVLVDLLKGMADRPGDAKTRYLLALLMIRRRMLRPQSRHEPSSSGARGEDEPEVLRVEIVGEDTTIDVPVCDIGLDEADRLRDELNEWIYCEAEE